MRKDITNSKRRRLKHQHRQCLDMIRGLVKRIQRNPSWYLLNDPIFGIGKDLEQPSISDIVHARAHQAHKSLQKLSQVQ